MKKEDKPLISLENYSEYEKEYELNRYYNLLLYSPRSLQACKMEGVLLKSIKYKTIEEFGAPGKPVSIQEIEYEKYMKKRKSNS